MLEKLPCRTSASADFQLVFLSNQKTRHWRVFFKYTMIRFLHEPRRFSHTDRSYLTQWFSDDLLIVTDVDINEEQNLESMIKQNPCKNVLIDLSHNQMNLRDIPVFLHQHPILTTEWSDWYQPSQTGVHYFPLWLWMFSNRSNQFFQRVVFDAHGRKTVPMMCLNRNQHPHRVRFREMIEPIRDKIVYTFGHQHLEGDQLDPNGWSNIDISVGHPVYSQCAVNIVTESVVDRLSLSEKSAKPFVARQIPVLIGAPGINQFYTDLGLDMFADLVPWQTWDHVTDHELRLQHIADFVIAWYQSGNVLDNYHSVKSRVETNKQYFHSDQFRSVFLKRMPNLNHY